MKRLPIFTWVSCVRQDLRLGRIAGILLMSAASIFAVASVFLQAAFPQSTANFLGGGPPGGAASDPGVRTGTPGAGQPLAGLTTGQLGYFNQGLAAFQEVIFVQNPPPGGDAGLGPRFNSDSCVSCHAAPAVGGSSPPVNLQIAAATAMGASNHIPLFIKPNGPTLEVRFRNNPNGTPDGGVHALFTITGRSDAPGCNIQQDDFSNTSNLSFRIPTPVFGGGLIEAIPDATLRSNLSNNPLIKAALGISGKLNTSGNDGTVTRFGWKAQNKSLHIFAAEAYNVENGVTSDLFPQERDETPGCGFNVTPESSLDFETGAADDPTVFAAFMALLAPPSRGGINASVTNGAQVFSQVGCALCHTPSLQTGVNPIAALSQQPVNLYSDLAVHGMGPGLAEGIVQGNAAGDEFRTAPLWGLGQRVFFLHDGRTSNLLDAIRAHASAAAGSIRASEANGVIRRFNQLNSSDQQSLLNFLRSL
jgi:CxxC motif-containing protein (DUF1111 family)